MSTINTINPGEVFYGQGDRGDIHVSYEDYHEIVSILHDDRLSRKTQMDFKNLHEVNFYGSFSVLLYCVPPALVTTYALCGGVRKSHSGYRIQWPYFLLTYPMWCLGAYTLPIPRRLYTKVLCNYEDDGTYIRNTIKMKKPGLWRKLSRQLYSKGYRFPEQIEQVDNAIEFPTDLVKNY